LLLIDLLKPLMPSSSNLNYFNRVAIYVWALCKTLEMNNELLRTFVKSLNMEWYKEGINLDTSSVGGATLKVTSYITVTLCA